MTTLPRILLAAAALLAGAKAQDQATTLAAGCRDADAIVLATVTAATDPSPDWHRLEWRVDETLKGRAGAAFALLEPAGACCGRSLFTLAAGQQRLLLLRRTGATLHPLGGARGVVAVTPAVVAHVRALLAAADPRALAALLARSLDHAEARVAHDAAHALAALPDLALGAEDRDRVVAALRLAAARGLTTTAPLVEGAVRCADGAVLDAVLPLYLDEPRGDVARLLRAGLARARPELLTERMPVHLSGDPARELRAAELLRRLPDAHADPAMRTLLVRTASPRVKLCLAEGLLAAGAAPSTLRRDVPAPVLELAARRVARAGFRSIRPEDR